MSLPPQMIQGAIFVEILDEVRDLVNASGGQVYGTASTSPKYPERLIIAAIQRADEVITGYFLNIPNHPRRIDFMTQVSVNHGGQIPAHIGPIGSVFVNGKLAEQWSASEIEIIREQVAAGLIKVAKAKYREVDNRLYFSDASGTDTALVDIANFKQLSMGLMTPPEFRNAVIAWALAYIFGKDASDTELPGSTRYGELAESTLKFVASNQVVPPLAQEAMAA